MRCLANLKTTTRKSPEVVMLAPMEKHTARVHSNTSDTAQEHSVAVTELSSRHPDLLCGGIGA
jgi:hypothetical protein